MMVSPEALPINSYGLFCINMHAFEFEAFPKSSLLDFAGTS